MKRSRSSSGYALLSVLAVVSALLIAGGATITLVRSQLRFTADQIATQMAYYIAEAGIQHGLAQLDNDAATATTAGYVYPTIPTTSFGDGTYTITIAQDGLYSSPLDRSRKQISSVGTFRGKQTTLVAHVLVQAPEDCCNGMILCSLSSGGSARLDHLALALTTIFNGNIFSNRDVHLNSTIGLLPVATGNVYAVGNFYSEGIVLGTSMAARLYRGGSYNNALDLLHLKGFHFANGGSGHGSGPAPSSRPMPVVDWDSAKRDPRTVIVNQDNYTTVAPGSSWGGGTWSVNTFSLSPSTRYYVDGSVNISGLSLIGGASSEVWARGSIQVGTFSVLSALSEQSLALVGEEDVVIGGGAGGLVSLLNRTNILAFSSLGEAQVDNGVTAVADTRACIVGGGGDATYRALAAALSSVSSIR